MGSSEALEARLRALEDVEAVKQTMYRYWRCLDEKLSDAELAECFTEDVVGDYGMPGWQAHGREELLRFLTPERRPAMQLSHGGHNPEVERPFLLLDAQRPRDDEEDGHDDPRGPRQHHAAGGQRLFGFGGRRVLQQERRLLRGQGGVEQAGLAAEHRVRLGGVRRGPAPREPQDDVEVARREVIEVSVHDHRPTIPPPPAGRLACPCRWRVRSPASCACPAT